MEDDLNECEPGEPITRPHPRTDGERAMARAAMREAKMVYLDGWSQFFLFICACAAALYIAVTAFQLWVGWQLVK